MWPKTGLVHESFQNFLERIDRNKNSYMFFLAFSLPYDSDLCVCNSIAGYIQELPIPDSGLCGHKRYLCMNYSNPFGQNTPKQKQLHVFSCIFTPTWFWLVRLLYQCRLYIKSAYTWFWLVWPKTGLVHQLLQIFLARIDRNKNSYMYFLAFSPSRDSDLSVCYTSAGYTQELPIHDCGLCGQKRDLCMNYSKSSWPE